MNAEQFQAHLYEAAKRGAESNILADGFLAMIGICEGPRTEAVAFKCRHFFGSDSGPFGFVIRNNDRSNTRQQIGQLFAEFHNVCIVLEMWGAPFNGDTDTPPSERPDRYEMIGVTLYQDGQQIVTGTRRFSKDAYGKVSFIGEWIETDPTKRIEFVAQPGSIFPQEARLHPQTQRSASL